MKKITIPIIIGISAAITIGIAIVGMSTNIPISENTVETSPNVEAEPGFGHPEALISGPLTITKPEHKISENIFFIISGLEKNEKGNIRVFMPDGRLWKTIAYDGSEKTNFNQYFKPDTSAFRKICEQEELVGRWLVSFDDNVYPPLTFEILNEHLNGPDVRLPSSC